MAEPTLVCITDGFTDTAHLIRDDRIDCVAMREQGQVSWWTGDLDVRDACRIFFDRVDLHPTLDLIANVELEEAARILRRIDPQAYAEMHAVYVCPYIGVTA